MCAREQHGFKKFLCKFISHMLPFLYKEVGISIHAPRVGRDRTPRHCHRRRGSFNPRAPCGARLPRISVIFVGFDVSIYAPRVGRDCSGVLGSPAATRFNPRAPCGARLAYVLFACHTFSFNPRAPCGARHCTDGQRAQHRPFQSTRPVWGATYAFRQDTPRHRFQSTRPVWGATGRSPTPLATHRVSIHAPHAGRDQCGCSPQWSGLSFNPRAPCGARPVT